MQPEVNRTHTDQRITLRQWLCARTPKDTGSRRLTVSLGTHRRRAYYVGGEGGKLPPHGGWGGNFHSLGGGFLLRLY